MTEKHESCADTRVHAQGKADAQNKDESGTTGAPVPSQGVLGCGSLRQIIMAVLNGNSFAIVVALIPSALVSQILLALPTTVITTQINMIVTLAQCTLPILAACAVGHMLKLSLLESGSMALACFVSAGNTHMLEKGFSLGGPGVILNIILVSFMAVLVARLCDKCLGQLKMVLLPFVVTLVAGGIGLLTLPVMAAIQAAVGNATAMATEFTPLVMGIVLGIIFAILVVSPFSSVGIATAISLAGIASGAANAGICAGAFTLAIMGAQANPIGGTLAHFVGSPKIQMANLLARPKLFIPVIISAGIAGFFASFMNLCGTPFSAGFGISGLIGPLTALQTSSGELLGLRVALGFVIIPLICATCMHLLFNKVLRLTNPDELKLPQV